MKPEEELLENLEHEARAGGYFINPDRELVLDLMRGLLVNQQRYGYLACPCRLAEGSRDKDRDIICPCDYRDSDLEEFGACYCGLYVSQEVAEGRRKLRPVPERRGSEEASGKKPASGPAPALPAYPVWRCKVCGYLCAREKPPLKCPVCKADQDRFERFW